MMRFDISPSSLKDDLFGGLPSAGVTMRTLVNVPAGGRSRLSGVVHSIILAAVVLGFGGLVSLISIPVLAAILVKVGIDIIDWQYVKRVHVVLRSELAIMLTTLLLTVLVDLITAVTAGFVMVSVLFVARVAESQVKGARFVFGADDIDDLTPEESELLSRGQGRLVLFGLRDPVREMLQKSGALADLDENQIINSRTDAIKLGLSIIEGNEVALKG